MAELTDRVRRLLEIALLTRHRGMTPEQAAAAIDRYVSHRLRRHGRLPEHLLRVESHLDVCPACRETARVIIACMQGAEPQAQVMIEGGSSTPVRSA